MASSNQADDATLPIAQPPLPQEQRPTTPLAATHPTLDNPVESQRMEYLRVMDMRIDTAEVVTCFGDARVWRGRNSAVAVPPQPDQTIRIIFDGRSYVNDLTGMENPEYPQCFASNNDDFIWGRLWGVYDPSPLDIGIDIAQAANSSFRYQQPVLRRIWQQNPCPGWYKLQIHGMHHYSCEHSDRENRPLGYDTCERSLVSFTSCKDANGNQIFIILAPDSSWSSWQCTSIAWRWLRAIETTLESPDSPRPIDGTPATTLQFLMFQILVTTLNFDAEFLDNYLFRNYRTNWTISKWERMDSIMRKPFEVKNSIIILRNIQESLAFLSAAIEDLTECMRSKLSGKDEGNVALSLQLDNVREDCKFYQLKTSRSITNQTEAFEVLNHFTQEKQASSVEQLSLLAAFFLPLSLAAGVLSIQTRFADLKLLLYDFVGVVFILGALAALLFVVNRYGSRVFDSIFEFLYTLLDNYNTSHLIEVRIRKIYKLILISLCWVACLASFLTGMLKDVNSGLEVLKFEALGIASVIILSMLLAFCRRTYLDYHI